MAGPLDFSWIAKAIESEKGRAKEPGSWLDLRSPDQKAEAGGMLTRVLSAPPPTLDEYAKGFPKPAQKAVDLGRGVTMMGPPVPPKEEKGILPRETYTKAIDEVLNPEKTARKVSIGADGSLSMEAESPMDKAKMQVSRDIQRPGQAGVEGQTPFPGLIPSRPQSELYPVSSDPSSPLATRKDAWERYKQGLKVPFEFPPSGVDEYQPQYRMPDIPQLGMSLVPPMDAEAPLPEGADAGGFLGKAWDFLGSPQFAHMAGQVGAAMAQPGSPGRALGELGSSLAQGRAYGAYQEALETGGDLTQGQFNILTPEMKEKAIQAQLAKKKMGLEERGMKVEEERLESLKPVYGAQAEQARAVAEGTLTVEEKREETGLQRMQDWKLGEMQHGMMKLGPGLAIDTRTRKIIDETGKLPKDEKANASMYRLMVDMVGAKWLPIVVQRQRDKRTAAGITPDEQAILSMFRSERGLELGPIKAGLTEEENKQLAFEMSLYPRMYGENIDPLTTHSILTGGGQTPPTEDQPQQPKTGPTRAPRQEANTETMSDGTVWQTMPDGTRKRIK